MTNRCQFDNELRPIAFGYVGRSKVKVVVNKKREVVRVPPLLHKMTIWSQRRWCKRNRVDFSSLQKLTSKALARELVA